jgi:hypothetical protein
MPPARPAAPQPQPAQMQHPGFTGPQSGQPHNPMPVGGWYQISDDPNWFDNARRSPNAPGVTPWYHKPPGPNEPIALPQSVGAPVMGSVPPPDDWTAQGVGYQGGPIPPSDPHQQMMSQPGRVSAGQSQPGGFPFWGPYHESGQAGMSSPSGMAGGGLMPGSSSGRADGASGSMYRNMRTLGQLGSAGKVFGL